MNKYPTDFVCSVSPFEDEDIENFLCQSTKDVSYTIDLLKLREVNATSALQRLRNNIEKLIIDKETEVNNFDPLNNSDFTALHIDNLRKEIKELEELL